MAPNRRAKIRIVLVAIAALVGLLVPNLPASRTGQVPGQDFASAPFGLGEELRYVIRWGVVPAGHGTITISDSAREEGVYHIVTTARSNAFVDTFYKVRNRIESFLDLKKHASVGYRKIQREGNHNRDVDLVFDHGENRVTLVRNGKIKREITVPGSIHDPLSAIYYLRTVPSFDHGPVALNVTDGKKSYLVSIRVLGREVVETPLGYFNTIKIEPTVEDMEIIFEKKKGGKLFIWLTDDERKVPVKMKSELYFGSIQAVLSDASLGTRPN
jgi:hypothetical protein